MTEMVRRHYELYPYPQYPLLASVRRCDTYALNLEAIWTRFNGALPPQDLRRLLIAGCGSFSPYPFALANAYSSVTALDLSRKSLRRARLHCLLHGMTGVDFVAGDLVDRSVAAGPFGFIDAYGVLHHLEDPLTGLRALAARLGEGGIIRVMLYSRYTRREEESIRRALAILKVREPAQIISMVRRSKPNSRLKRFFASSDETAFRAGLADALLHPLVHTYRINALMELVAASGLEPLLFAHASALPEVAAEVERIREMEKSRRSPGNFILYLGHGVKGPCRDRSAVFRINPCLADAVTGLKLRPVAIAGRMGHRNEPLDQAARRFLRRFRTPVRGAELTEEELGRAHHYSEELFLLRYRDGNTG